jgi:hypothetical protein
MLVDSRRLLGALALLGAAGCTQPTAPPPDAFTSASTGCGTGALGKAIAPYSLGVGSSDTDRGVLAFDTSSTVFALNAPGAAVLENASPDGQVTTLGAIDEEIRQVQLDATSVYYATPGGLFSMPRSGGPPLKISPAVDDFAVGTEAIYASSGTSPATLSFVPGDGATTSVVYSAYLLLPISNLQFDGLNVYWLETQGASQIQPTASTVIRMGWANGATLQASDVVTLPAWTNGVLTFGVSGGNLVYVTVNVAESGAQTVLTYQVYLALAGSTPVLVDSAPAGESLNVPLSFSGNFAYYDLGAGVRELVVDELHQVNTILPQPPAAVNALAFDSIETVVYATDSCLYRVANVSTPGEGL